MHYAISQNVRQRRDEMGESILKIVIDISNIFSVSGHLWYICHAGPQFYHLVRHCIRPMSFYYHELNYDGHV